METTLQQLSNFITTTVGISLIVGAVALGAIFLIIYWNKTNDFTYQRLLYAYKLYKNEVVKNKKSYVDFINIFDDYRENFFIDESLIINTSTVNREKEIFRNLVDFMRAEQAAIEDCFKSSKFRFLTEYNRFKNINAKIMKLKRKEEERLMQAAEMERKEEERLMQAAEMEQKQEEERLMQAADIEKKRNALIDTFMIEDPVSINELIERIGKYIEKFRAKGISIAAMIKLLREHGYLNQSTPITTMRKSISNYYNVYIGSDQSIVRYFGDNPDAISKEQINDVITFFKLNTQSNNETAKTNN